MMPTNEVLALKMLKGASVSRLNLYFELAILSGGMQKLRGANVRITIVGKLFRRKKTAVSIKLS
jgi:hypothetical protein